MNRSTELKRRTDLTWSLSYEIIQLKLSCILILVIIRDIDQFRVSTAHPNDAWRLELWKRQNVPCQNFELSFVFPLTVRLVYTGNFWCDFLLLTYVDEWTSYECSDESRNIRGSSTSSQASEGENRTRNRGKNCAGLYGGSRRAYFTKAGFWRCSSLAQGRSQDFFTRGEVRPICREKSQIPK